MLRLRKGPLPAISVPLGGDSVVMVRPATAFEIDLAVARTAKLLAGLIDNQDAITTAVSILGEEFGSADFARREWIESASQRLALLELATLCVVSWDGIVDDADQPIELSRETLALLFRSADAAARVGAVIRSPIHQVVDGAASGTSQEPNEADHG